METRIPEDEIATVFGGSGFVGRHTVRALAKEGWRIRAAVRRPDLAGHLQPMGRVGQIHAVQANVRFPDSLGHAVHGAHVVVNLVGILARDGAQTFRKVHVDGARAVARAAKEGGAERFVHISALGARRRARSRYARTKAEGEAAVLEIFPDAVIIRPSIVFGPEDDFFNRFARMATMSPFLPLIGRGRSKFQPVFVGDLAAAIAAACAGRTTPGTIYEVGGPEVLSMRQVLDRIQEWTGRQRRYVQVPFWVARVLSLLTLPLPNGLRPLTVDQVRLLKSDNVVTAPAIREDRTLAALGIAHPHAAGAIVPAYLERFRPRGQFSHYRG
jgi:uncharacterized protein YbjT (DUF2867 family)